VQEGNSPFAAWLLSCSNGLGLLLAPFFDRVKKKKKMKKKFSANFQVLFTTPVVY
jgi:hypothetical protein